jgi:hypothetical protein
VSDDADVQAFIDGVTPARRRRDAETMLRMMERVTGEKPRLFREIVYFGNYHYRYASGREGDSAPAAFAPRKRELVVYLSDGVGAHRSRLARLGTHRAGTVCVYITDLEKVDLGVLEEIVATSFRTLTGGGATYTRRAREGRAAED